MKNAAASSVATSVTGAAVLTIGSPVAMRFSLALFERRY
jgi:hypothetical protein